MKKFFSNHITSSQAILLVSGFLILFSNVAFFSHVLGDYPFLFKNAGFLISLGIGFAGFLIVLLSVLCHPYTIKAVLIFILLTSSAAAYFMDGYNVLIDESMIQNIFSTNVGEAGDLISFGLFVYILFLGVLPSLYIYYADIRFRKPLHELILRLRLMVVTLAIIAALALAFSSHCVSFFREHKVLRYYFNPSGYLYGIYKYTRHSLASGPQKIERIGLDARIPESDVHRELIIVVVGETARADRFSLNGYGRETNPELKKENVVSFTNFWSCGTATAVSVPCMFSHFGAHAFDNEKAERTENALDVLRRAGVNVLWLDNNSSSKGVADRVTYKDYREPSQNPDCDDECRDEGMLAHLQEYIDSYPKGDIAIVLHQMGNHGPAYYKRYPASFEKFKPACHTNELSQCSEEEINNAYDNAILYTDYFLSKVIGILKHNSDKFEAAMLYVSDHGESLGENGIYLHGMPNFIAPDAQRHIPAIIWASKSFDEVDMNALKKRRDEFYTHDNLFHTLLGFMEIQTKVYNPKLDILRQ